MKRYSRIRARRAAVPAMGRRGGWNNRVEHSDASGVHIPDGEV
jgi:hypothetical protein